MKNDRDDWELLNAHADGELGLENARALERRLANDPALAAELAQIMALKVGLAALHPVPAPPAVDHTSALRLVTNRHLAAAAVVLLLVTAGIAYGLFGAGATRVAGIGDIHKAFSERTYFVDLDRQVLVSAGTGIGDLDAPDLSPSNLTLVDVKTFTATARIAMHYRGRSGCRITLVVDTADTTPFARPDTAALIYLWRTPTRRFALIAEGMDENRFVAIGAFAEAQSVASERQREFRTALVERTAAARPCA